MKLYRIPSADGEPKWGHPNGWRIRRWVRDWDGRSTGPGGRGMSVGPKRGYIVTRLATRSSRATAVEHFDRLRDARAWCDEHEARVAA